MPINVQVSGTGAYTTPPGPGQPPLAAPTYLPKITYNGRDITSLVMFADAEFVSQVNGTPGTCRFRVRDDEHGLSFRAGGRLNLKINGQNEWTGYVSRVERRTAFPYGSPSQTRFFFIDGVDVNILFRRRVVYRKSRPKDVSGKTYSYNGTPTKDTTALADLLSGYVDLRGDGIDTTTLVTNVGDINVDQKTNPWSGGWTWEQAMTKINTLPCAVYYINPDRKLVWADPDTATAPFSLSDMPNYSSSWGYREMEILYDGSQLANDYLAWGAGAGSNQMVFRRLESTSSIESHERWQKSTIAGDIYKQATINKLASSYVNGSPTSRRGHKNDRISVSCTTFRQGIQAGMGVSFTCNAFGFTDVLPARVVRITFPTPVNPRYDLTLSHEIDAEVGAFDVFIPTFDIPSFPVVTSGSSAGAGVWKTIVVTSGGTPINDVSGYESAGYNDDDWNAPVEVESETWSVIPGTHPMADPKVYDETYLEDTLWVGRIEFDLAVVPTVATATVNFDSYGTLKINGNTVTSSGPVTSFTEVSVPISYFVSGTNCLSFSCQNYLGGSTWATNPSMAQVLLVVDGETTVTSDFGVTDEFSRTVSDGWGSGPLGTWVNEDPSSSENKNTIVESGRAKALYDGIFYLFRDIKMRLDGSAYRSTTGTISWVFSFPDKSKLLRLSIGYESSDGNSYARLQVQPNYNDMVYTHYYGSSYVSLTYALGEGFWVANQDYRAELQFTDSEIRSRVYRKGDTAPDWLITTERFIGQDTFMTNSTTVVRVRSNKPFPDPSTLFGIDELSFAPISSTDTSTQTIVSGGFCGTFSGSGTTTLYVGSPFFAGTTRIWRNGYFLAIGTDYTENPGFGTVTFPSPTLTSDVFVVQYAAATETNGGLTRMVL